MKLPDDLEPDDADAREQLSRAFGFVRRMLRKWWIIPLALLFGAAACAAFLWIKGRTYHSETVLLYSEPIRTGNNNEAPTDPRNTAMRFEELLLSRSQLERVIGQYDLYPDRVHDYGVVDAVAEFRKHVQFKAPGGDTFSIAFEGTAPEQTQRVTARLAELLIEEDARLKSQQAKVTRDFLAVERKRTEKELRDAEQNLAEFMAKHPKFALDVVMLQPGAPVTGAAIRASMAHDPRPSGGGAARAYTYTRPSEARGAASSPSVAVPGDQQAKADRARAEAALVAARSDLATKQAQFTDAHPDVREAQAAVAAAQARLASLSTADPTPATPVAEAASQPREESRRAVREEARPRSVEPRSAPKNEGELVALETDWARLTRGVTEARQRHDHIDAAFFKADVASSESGREAPRISIVDPAFLPQRPVPPGPLTIGAIFAALALALGVASMALATLLDDRIYSARDAIQIAKVLVEIPRNDKRRRAYAAAT